ncbi:OxaA precursor [Anaerobacillus alkalilacustris]|uniref:Membrane protein insertase YidC n=1 Tax=Anaerobacillus alkalilacustris TaxID=393763 RepID=A0A1S2LDG1_9BACI|nr:membrane protein insertase YidC [Anaerobacillus alkalilacustris]OIJ10529.1 OxaA precursor [Anaerobacillus alkalilacustris]
MGKNLQLLTSKYRKGSLVLVLILTLVSLTGCGMTAGPITADSPGVFNHYLVYPFSWLLLKTAVVFGNSFGFSIITVTILIRFMLLPLMIKQTKNMKAMRLIQPKLNELKEKYSGKGEKNQRKLQEETMMLFKAEGVNPIGSGCLPLLIQMPIMLAFYYAIMRTEELALHSFLWFDLGAPDPLYILPILAAITTFIQLKVTAAQNPVNTQMAIVNNIMPAMILVFAISLPSALSLYWVVGGIFGIAQAYFLNIDRSQIKQETANS